MSDVRENETEYLQVYYQPRLLSADMSEADPTYYSWQLAVSEVNEEGDELFETVEEACRAGVAYIYEISSGPKNFLENFDRFVIARISCGYVPLKCLRTSLEACE